MSGKKIHRYLGYALGEILLVVFGILIALSINNWNEHRKKRDKEKDILQDIQTALISDLSDISLSLETIDKAIRYLEHLEEYAKGEKLLSDTVQRYFPAFLWSFNFNPMLGPYESLKAFGLDIVNSDTLRNEIIRIYDVQYDQLYLADEPLFVKAQMAVENLIDKHFRFTGQVKDYMSISLAPSNIEALVSAPDFQAALTARTFYLYIYKARILGVESDVKAILELIKEDLDDR
ncbi:MAG: hypothetical protein HEP71_03475 [Roseivirga sp.]|nr:hypothetical protein [Roseivirga sp.]